MPLCRYLLGALLILAGFGTLPIRAQDLSGILGAAANQKEATKVRDGIYFASGFGNTFMVTTAAGNVIIDTSMREIATRHQKLLRAVSDGPIRYIIVTHGHGDHAGGVKLWRQPETQVIVQQNFNDFVDYQYRLGDFFAHRNAAQFGLNEESMKRRFRSGERLQPTITFDDHYEFELGGLKFELFHTPGETPDHLTVWIPQHKAAFVGDNYYASFPNMYTLRGTTPRWPLEYIASLNKVLSLKPEILLPSHGDPIHGNAAITAAVTRYRDAIQFVHDATVKGMNEGKDVYTLMREVQLPPELDVGDAYGKVSWSVRGIYESYVGWFDGNPASMYETPPSATSVDLVQLAGGPNAVAKQAGELVAAGELVRGLRMADAALAADATNKAALEVRIKARGIEGQESKLERKRLVGLRIADDAGRTQRQIVQPIGLQPFARHAPVVPVVATAQTWRPISLPGMYGRAILTGMVRTRSPVQATFVEDREMVTSNIHRSAPALLIALVASIATPAAGQRTPPTPQPVVQPTLEEPRPVQATQPRLEQPSLREPAPQPDLNLRPASPARPSNAPLRPATTYRGVPQAILPQGDEPQGETSQQMAATQQDREWLIAYLISHEGYNIHQMDQLEARLDHMSPTLIGSLVMLYKQKHERALQREAAVQAMRRNMVAADESMLRRNQTALNQINSDENAAAQHEQSVIDTQRQQTTQGYFQNAPYRSMPYYGGGYGGYGYPYQYFPAYGY